MGELEQRCVLTSHADDRTDSRHDMHGSHHLGDGFHFMGSSQDLGRHLTMDSREGYGPERIRVLDEWR